MPVYKVTAPDGRSLKVTGDRPPTETELQDIFTKTGATHQNPAADSGPQKDTLDRIADLLPMAGGMAGGIAGGGLASIPLAALGGAGGAGFKNLYYALRHGTGATNQADVAKDLGTEAATQAAYEAGGQVAGKALGWAGKQIYRRVLKPPLGGAGAAKAAEIVDTGLREQLNPFAQKHIARAGEDIASLKQATEDIVAAPAVTASGAQYSPLINPKPIAAKTIRTMEKFAGAGAAPEDRAAAESVRRNFLGDVSKDVQVPTQVPSQILDASGNPTMTTVMQTQKRVAPLSGKELLEGRRAAGRSAGSNSFGVTRGAETEGRKELYHNMGEELQAAYANSSTGKSLKDVMNRERQLIDWKKAALGAHEREASGSLTSLRRLLPWGAGGASFLVNGDVKDAAEKGLMIELLTNPRLAARSALMMEMAKRYPQLLSNTGRVVGAGTGMLLDQ